MLVCFKTFKTLHQLRDRDSFYTCNKRHHWDLNLSLRDPSRGEIAIIISCYAERQCWDRYYLFLQVPALMVSISDPKSDGVAMRLQSISVCFMRRSGNCSRKSSVIYYFDHSGLKHTIFVSRVLVNRVQIYIQYATIIT